MKYRKRPVVVEAFQYDGDMKTQDGKYYVPEWAQKALEKGDMFFDAVDSDSPPSELYIKTLEGIHRVSVGNYIIQGIKGELYPCKPDIFKQTYEVASDTDVLVKKNDCLMREVDESAAEVFEVVAADCNVFVIAPIAYDEKEQCCMTDYEKLRAYSNEPKINSLQELGFKKVEK